MTTNAERELLIRLKSGDTDAYNTLYDRYSLFFYQRIRSLVKIDTIAQDILQDVFIKIWDRRAQIQEDKSFKSYLYRIAQNEVYDHYRRVSLDHKAQEEITMHMGFSFQDDTILHKEVQEHIDLAIQQLPPKQRLIFELCKIEGKTYKEASEILQISESTVNAQIVSATKKVKLYLSNSGIWSLLLLSILK
ncbi:hypothetical protein M472_02855 [Sphingobacterium paucimobilis HER1398]|uniref:RNA polymerase sigma factor n=1 Tax=Sphingobacterium paucimobilis HER1398 TaxID=1346330 RepID=U2J4W0_9SPHI|nr:hypothetical protein M472_02855 [Sphingobacterium paucimobilis HER1398]